MWTWLARLTVNRRLAVLAFLLGLGAVFASVEPRRVVAIHEKDLLTTVARQEDHVSPQQLADWIITGRSDYRLIDLHDETDFAQYHIPTAENVPLAALTDAGLLRNQRIVMYSEGGIHSAQAWMLLKAEGYAGASTLLGGLDAWKDEILFPALPKDVTPEQRAHFERTAAISRFFGGQPRTGGDGDAAKAPDLPRVAPPTLSGSAPSAKPPKKRKEGC